MQENQEEGPDVSGLQVKLNGHPHKVTGFRIVSGEGENKDKKWLQLGIEDVATSHNQCVEFEMSGLIGLWNHFTGVPDKVRSVVSGVTGVGKDVVGRLERAAKAYRADPPNKEEK